MPITMKPKKYEEIKDFNKRCMNNAGMISDYSNREQRKLTRIKRNNYVRNNYNVNFYSISCT
jgi:hypothetical protein